MRVARADHKVLPNHIAGGEVCTLFGRHRKNARSPQLIGTIWTKVMGLLNSICGEMVVLHVLLSLAVHCQLKEDAGISFQPDFLGHFTVSLPLTSHN